jgi:SAM-dependent methyltransferase
MTATSTHPPATATATKPSNTGSPRYHTDFVFTDRATRAKFTALKYAAILQGSVLDVGCDQRYLREYLPRPDLYLGVDLGPPADLCINLDRENLPFDAASFDTIVCTDVLEHLERIHAVFDELLRVARHRVIVSLPAPLSSLLGDLSPGTGPTPTTGPGNTGWKKFYGLPIDPPADRHRWFFGFEDAKRFFEHRSQRLGWRIEQLDCQWEGCGDWRHADGTPVKWTDNEKRGGPWCVLEPVR